jgi:HAD superfamily hydrolase (TIGR01458 family)
MVLWEPFFEAFKIRASVAVYLAGKNLAHALCYTVRVKPPTLQAVLLDLDGVMYVGDKIIAGADRTLAALRDTGYGLHGVTNTTTMPRRAIADKLRRMGLDLDEHELATPAALAVQAIGTDSAALFIRDSLRDDFSGIREDEHHPAWIVMGDPGGAGYPPESLQRIFRLCMDGAAVLALHKNRFWQKPDGLYLDLGAFVAAIEYATGKDATVLGKPSPDFFRAVCTDLAVETKCCLMVGDDIESDIGGAQRVGMRTALVQTGKYRPEHVRNTMRTQGIRPDLTLPSIADLPESLALL